MRCEKSAMSINEDVISNFISSIMQSEWDELLEVATDHFDISQIDRNMLSHVSPAIMIRGLKKAGKPISEDHLALFNSKHLQSAQSMFDPDTLEITSPLGWLGSAFIMFDIAEYSRQQGCFELAMRFVCQATESRGSFIMSVVQEQKKVAKARKGGIAKHKRNNEQKRKAIEMWKKTIAPGISAERAAELLRNEGIALAHSTLSRTISKEKRKLSS